MVYPTGCREGWGIGKFIGLTGIANSSMKKELRVGVWSMKLEQKCGEGAEKTFCESVRREKSEKWEATRWQDVHCVQLGQLWQCSGNTEGLTDRSAHNVWAKCSRLF